MADVDYLKKLQMAMTGEQPYEAPRDEYVTAPELEPEDVLDIDKMQKDISDMSSSSIQSAQEAELRDPSGAIEDPIIPQEPEEEEFSPQERLIQELRRTRSESKEEARLAQEESDKKAMLANVIRTLGNLGQADVQRSAGIKVGLEPSKMQQAKDVKSPILKERDSMLKQLMEEYNLLNKVDGDMTPYQKRSLDLQQKRLDLLEGKEGRLSKKDLFQEEVKGRLSDKEVEGINALDDGMRILDEIEDIIKKTDIEEDLGPYSSRIEGASKYIPGMEQNPEFVKMQQLVGINLADYVKSISGAQVSEQEAQRLLKNIPNMTDNPGEFKTKLSTFRKELKSAKKDYLENIGKQKKGASKFLDQLEKDKKKSDAPHGETVERNGKMYKWNPIVKKYQLI